jgi:hypothetical protein
MMHTPYFLFSDAFLTLKLPTSLSDDWSAFGGSCEGTIFATMLGMRESGLETEFGSSLPQDRIVIAHPRCLPLRKPLHAWSNYLVCWQQDHMRCDYAHCHIVMNTTQLNIFALSKYDRYLLPGPRHHLHYIPEPSLLPRSRQFSTNFKTVGYLGARKNLLPELQSDEWISLLKSYGLFFQILDEPGLRSNYETIDAILAVRPSGMQDQKSPHKLWNAWRAGVPAILGPEPGFRDYRQSELDYIEVNNAEEAFQALIRLRDDPDLRRAMVENGIRRMHECSVETIIGQWKDFIEGPLQEYANDWFYGPRLKRELFGMARSLRIELRSLRPFMK